MGLKKEYSKQKQGDQIIPKAQTAQQDFQIKK